MLPGRPWRNHPHLYQINTWAWLDSLARDRGRETRLRDVPHAVWDGLKELGVDIVYLLGVWKRSLAGRRLFRTDPAAFRNFDHAVPDWTIDSVIGSPFSIEEYVPDPRIGDWSDIDSVRRALNQRGMRLVLDFVPNHTGPDHVWIAAHPEYFLQGAEADFHTDPSAFHLIEPAGAPPIFIARGRDPFFAPWADTAQVDYFNPAARTAMIRQLATIAKHCDGLRCDMAMLALNDVFGRTWAHLLRDRPAPATEFWPEAIAALPADFLWMAEVYWDMEGRLQSLGFDFTYDKALYDRLRTAPTREIRAGLTSEFAFQSRMARFLENHDEPRSVAAFGRGRVPILAALIATLPGLRFFHQGQFVGKTVHLPMPLNRAADETPDTALKDFYEHLLAIADDKAFHGTDWALLEVEPVDDTADELIAYRWGSGPTGRFVVLNLGEHSARGKLRVAAELPPAGRYRFDDLLNDKSYLRDWNDLSEHGLYVGLEGWSGHIFGLTAEAEPAGD